MRDFGYNIMQPTRINIYRTDKSLWERVKSDAPEFKGCLSCGACAAACPLNSGSERVSIRKTVIELNRGIQPTSEVTSCQMCNRCTLVCPKGLNTRRINFLIAKYRSIGSEKTVLKN